MATNYFKSIALSALLLNLSPYHLSTVALGGSHCGWNYEDAIMNCDAPCSFVGIDTVNCAAGQYCFGPDLPCKSGTTNADGEKVDVIAELGDTLAPLKAHVDGEDEQYSHENTAGENEVITTVPNLGNADWSEMPTASPTSTVTSDATDEATDETTPDGSVIFALLGSKPADETNSTAAPTASPSYSPSSATPTSSPNDTPAPTTESPTITAMPTEFERERWANERRNMTNPSMHYCGT